MIVNSQGDYSNFINKLEELINTVENRQSQTFNAFCAEYGKLDNFITFKNACHNFLKSSDKEVIDKFFDEQFLVNFWINKGFVHESLLREHQQRHLLKAILKKVNDFIKEYLKCK